MTPLPPDPDTPSSLPHLQVGSSGPLHALGPLAAVVAGNRRHTSALKQKGGMLNGGECVRPPRRPRAYTRALRSGDGGYACTCGLSGRLYSTQASVAGVWCALPVALISLQPAVV